MGVFDIILSVGIIVIGALGCVTSVVRKPRRGQSKFVGFVVSLLMFICGIICLVFGYPVSEYI
ncbi:MAG: hypothetical protein ACI4JY_02105 [Oscillospiraceae bacterium]